MKIIKNYYSTTDFSLKGMFDREDILAGLAILTTKVALKEGSSKHGKALRASVGENCVLTINLRKIFGNLQELGLEKILLLTFPCCCHYPHTHSCRNPACVR